MWLQTAAAVAAAPHICSALSISFAVRLLLSDWPLSDNYELEANVKATSHSALTKMTRAGELSERWLDLSSVGLYSKALLALLPPVTYLRLESLHSTCHTYAELDSICTFWGNSVDQVWHFLFFLNLDWFCMSILLSIKWCYFCILCVDRCSILQFGSIVC